ncbi:MAG: cytochrome c3 family protein [Candidatus Methanospirare jalkutatii]|nr:cytochrome c3 family protein [Candidatus Methanospirare jalkutatii]
MEKGEKVLVALVVLTFVGFLGGAAVMQQQMKHMPPESCYQMCHEMKPFYDSFEASVHAKEIKDCHECHESEKPEMFLYAGEMLKHLERQYFESKGIEVEEIEEKPPSSPKREICKEKCHNGVKAKAVSEKVAPKGTSCETCHTEITHAEHKIGEYGKKFRGYESPSYEGRECVACHNDHSMRVNEDTCLDCHPFHPS